MVLAHQKPQYVHPALQYTHDPQQLYTFVFVHFSTPHDPQEPWKV